MRAVLLFITILGSTSALADPLMKEDQEALLSALWKSPVAIVQTETSLADCYLGHGKENYTVETREVSFLGAFGIRCVETTQTHKNLWDSKSKHCDIILDDERAVPGKVEFIDISFPKIKIVKIQDSTLAKQLFELFAQSSARASYFISRGHKTFGYGGLFDVSDLRIDCKQNNPGAFECLAAIPFGEPTGHGYWWISPPWRPCLYEIDFRQTDLKCEQESLLQWSDLNP